MKPLLGSLVMKALTLPESETVLNAVSWAIVMKALPQNPVMKPLSGSLVMKALTLPETVLNAVSSTLVMKALSEKVAMKATLVIKTVSETVIKALPGNPVSSYPGLQRQP
jgi:hypothetical protein